jgi:periplasmic divalent cation tolerance protein
MTKSDVQILVILITTPNRREAVRIGQAVVKKKLAACANILSPVTSIFRWKGRIEKSQEALLIMKTTSRRYAALAKTIGSMHRSARNHRLESDKRVTSIYSVGPWGNRY